MGLLDDLQAAKSRRPDCTLCVTIQTIFAASEEEGVAVAEAAVGSIISMRALREVLAKNGHHIGRDTLAKHRAEGHRPL